MVAIRLAVGAAASRSRSTCWWPRSWLCSSPTRSTRGSACTPRADISRKRLARGRLDRVLRAAVHRSPASVDGEHDRASARTEERLPSGDWYCSRSPPSRPPCSASCRRRGEAVDVAVLSAASIMLFLVVVLRMVRLDPTAGRSAARACPARSRRGPGHGDEPRGIHAAAIEAAGPGRRRCGDPDVRRSGGDLRVRRGGAAGGDDAHGVRFAFSTLQEWKQQRLLDNDAYMVGPTRAPCAARSGCRGRRRIGLRGASSSATSCTA